ncbi:MAG: KEOPS complex subunit Pcc1 [Candidatus Nitrosocaldus sp.]|nr:KEOPS complex subunit Pcc1 [Candidatus Nitrosocaldus sp.]MDW8275771.1 KEOPS complex subunit Pcc1 [Candidatus Nitrosocaldus sp.]
MISDVYAMIEVEYRKGDGDDHGSGSGNRDVIRSIYTALEPECRASSKGKKEDVRISMRLVEDTRITLTINTGDVSTARAVLNSYLRFMDAAYRSLKVT